MTLQGSLTKRRRARAARRGMTLLEIVVAVAILSMISVLLYGAFDSLSRGKRGEAARADRSRQGREAINRISRELSSAYISLHNPLSPALIIRRTAFIASRESSNTDRLDFASFAHRRLERDAPESDQAEIGYFVTKDPDNAQKLDLVRREQTPIDLEPRNGGTTAVLAEDIETFELRYLDPITGQWLDNWDSTQQAAQLNRLPLQVKVTLVMKGIKDGAPLKFETKVAIPIQTPLTFGQPR
jgi:general secretion pathway protein J